MAVEASVRARRKYWRNCSSRLFQWQVNILLQSKKTLTSNIYIYLQDSREFQCQVLNRDLWSNFADKSKVGEHFVFWQQYKVQAQASVPNRNTLPYLIEIIYKESDQAERYMTSVPNRNHIQGERRGGEIHNFLPD